MTELNHAKGCITITILPASVVIPFFRFQDIYTLRILNFSNFHMAPDVDMGSFYSKPKRPPVTWICCQMRKHVRRSSGRPHRVSGISYMFSAS